MPWSLCVSSQSNGAGNICSYESNNGIKMFWNLTICTVRNVTELIELLLGESIAVVYSHYENGGLRSSQFLDMHQKMAFWQASIHV